MINTFSLFAICPLPFAMKFSVMWEFLIFSDEVFCHAGIPDFYKVRFSFLFPGFGDIAREAFLAFSQEKDNVSF